MGFRASGTVAAWEHSEEALDRHVRRAEAIAAEAMAAEAEAKRAEDEDPLSEREREVLRLLALGYTNQEIAKQLYISVRTAETHRAHIMQKLGLSSRAELVRYALDHGLLDETGAGSELFGTALHELFPKGPR